MTDLTPNQLALDSFCASTPDEDARKEFITGFHKRKVMRRKEAESAQARLLKEERLRLRAEVSTSCIFSSISSFVASA
jgi:hypothetical protein